jgi:hypothetical protein
MPHGPDRTPHGTERHKAVSIVAVLSCALANNAFAGQRSAHSSSDDRQLSERVAAIVEMIQCVEPTLPRDLPRNTKIAQWRN